MRLLRLLLIGFHIAGQVQRLGEDKCECKPHQAKQLEVHPGCFAEIKGHIEISQACNYEITYPAQIDSAPDEFGYGDGVTHHALYQRFIAQKLAAKERSRKQPVEDGRLPLNK